MKTSLKNILTTSVALWAAATWAAEPAKLPKLIDLGAVMRLGRGESQAGGNQRTALLCATFEALIGALYLDSGLEAVRAFAEPLLEPVADQIILSHRDQDPKSVLQELVQANGFGPPQYRTVSTTGPEHEKTFEVEVLINGQVYGRGTGHSKQAAAKEAAGVALDSLEVLNLG